MAAAALYHSIIYAFVFLVGVNMRSKPAISNLMWSHVLLEFPKLQEIHLSGVNLCRFDWDTMPNNISRMELLSCYVPVAGMSLSLVFSAR